MLSDSDNSVMTSCFRKRWLESIQQAVILQVIIRVRVNLGGILPNQLLAFHRKGRHTVKHKGAGGLEKSENQLFKLKFL